MAALSRANARCLLHARMVILPQKTEQIARTSLQAHGTNHPGDFFNVWRGIDFLDGCGVVVPDLAIRTLIRRNRCDEAGK